MGCGLLAVMLFAPPVSAADDVLVLGYRDIPGVIRGDREAVDRMTFIQHIEYLRMHGYVFVGLDDIIEAHNGGTSLPGNAVLLTFDNAYLSFYEFIYPVLQLYRCPCVLSVVTSWIGDPPADLSAPLMNWDQLGEVARNELVTIASGTHDLARGIEIDAVGSTGEAATFLAWDAYTGGREPESAYRERISRRPGFVTFRNQGQAGCRSECAYLAWRTLYRTGTRRSGGSWLLGSFLSKRNIRSGRWATDCVPSQDFHESIRR